GLHPEIRRRVRIYAVPQGGLVRSVSRASSERSPMGYKAIYTYAWDLADAGSASATRQFRSLGLDTVTIAGSYHAGKFLLPHGESGKVYFPEDGTVYFRADLRRYGAIKPV